jgi:hypothetical protein
LISRGLLMPITPLELLQIKPLITQVLLRIQLMVTQLLEHIIFKQDNQL